MTAKSKLRPTGLNAADRNWGELIATAIVANIISRTVTTNGQRR
jgi:hypothetical protein